MTEAERTEQHERADEQQYAEYLLSRCADLPDRWCIVKQQRVVVYDGKPCWDLKESVAREILGFLRSED